MRLGLSVAALAAGVGFCAGTLRAQPAFTPIIGPTCTGTYVYPLPHLSTETDTANTRYTTVVIIANFNPATAAVVQACAYNAGAFLGGTTFTLAINNRLYVTDPASTGTPPPGTRPAALASLFNLVQLPSNTAFPGVITSNIPLEIEYGFVGATNRVFTFGHPSLAGTVLGLAHIGYSPGLYPGFIVVSNPNNATVTYSLGFHSDDGTVALQIGNLTLSAFQRQRFDLSNITDSSGNSVSLRSFYSARVSSSGGGPVGAVSFIITPLGDVILNSMTPISP